jgi:hypothetical protein
MTPELTAVVTELRDALAEAEDVSARTGTDYARSRADALRYVLGLIDTLPA